MLNYGYYWPEKQLDFEPLDYMENDNGHTKMFWKDGNKWQQL
jgi:hypothetical protein